MALVVDELDKEFSQTLLVSFVADKRVHLGALIVGSGRVFVQQRLALEGRVDLTLK